MPQKNPHGRYMVKSEVVPYDIFVLNGNHDLPTKPGRWTIEALVHSDMARRGRARVREVGDWREAKVAREQKARDDLARDRARDPLLLAAMGRQADAYGMAAPTRDEMVAMETHAVRGMEYLSERDAKERRKARLGA
jgi:hypothetical protein